MTILHVKPAEGRAVLDPRTRAPLPAEGRRVEDSAYWRRRLADGDIVIVPDDAAPEKPAERKSKKEPSS